MKKVFKWVTIVIVAVVLLYFGFGYLSNYIGYYGKWKFRAGTTSIAESKNRGVFVNELHFKIENFGGKLDDFQAYIEKGYRFSRTSSEETVIMNNSNFPYQLAFGYNRYKSISVVLRKDQMEKFDSADGVRGFLKDPDLKDTVIANIVGDGVAPGIVKVWQ